MRDQNRVGLVGDPTECAAVEDQIRVESTNGLGYEGCTVTASGDLSFFNSATP